jgi:rhodanese-related sulfurtransferase
MKTFQDLVKEALKFVPEVDIYQLKKKIESNKQIRLIDIREDREWVSGRIPTAHHIGRGVLEKGIREVANSEDEIILYCASGFRSVLGSKSLNEMGFNNVFSLKGGITDWISAGFEIEE